MKKKRLLGCGLGAILIILGILPAIGDVRVWDIIVIAVGVGMIIIALTMTKNQKSQKQGERRKEIGTLISWILVGYGFFILFVPPIVGDLDLYYILPWFSFIAIFAGIISGGERVLRGVIGFGASLMVAVIILVFFASLVPVWKLVKPGLACALLITSAYCMAGGVVSTLITIRGDIDRFETHIYRWAAPMFSLYL